ncbi:hypothetical protein J6590_025706 [Homalodisca vitripennis]|nr:hypothetical protein J6590_025706 [Homalodisca vitripennis]
MSILLSLESKLNPIRETRGAVLAQNMCSLECGDECVKGNYQVIRQQSLTANTLASVNIIRYVLAMSDVAVEYSSGA